MMCEKIGQLVDQVVFKSIDAAAYLIWLVKAEEFEFKGSTMPANITIFEDDQTQ
jgi:hypothetical protein